MTSRRLRTIGVGFSLLAFTVGCSPAGEPTPRPPTARELQGSWIGVGQSGIPIYRLTLTSETKGMLVEYDVRSPFLAWTITKWDSRAGSITMEFQPITKNTERIQGQGRAERVLMSDVIRLTTEVQGKPGSTQTVVLRRETEQTEVVGKIRDWMEQYASVTRTNAPDGQPGSASNASQPIRSETNATPSAAGSRR